MTSLFLFSVRPRVCTRIAHACVKARIEVERDTLEAPCTCISEKYLSISRRVCQMLHAFPAQAKTVRRSEQGQCVRIARAKASFWDGCETYLKAKERTTLRVLTSGWSTSFLILLTIKSPLSCLCRSLSFFLYLEPLRGSSQSCLRILAKN